MSERRPQGDPGDRPEKAATVVVPGAALATARIIELETRVAELERQQAALVETLDRERRASAAGLEDASTLRLVLDHVPAMVGYIDREERCRLASRTVEQWLGRSREGLIGRTVAEILGPTTYSRIGSFIARALAGETVEYTRKVAYREGDVRQVRAAWVPTRDGDGAVNGVCVIIHDVTELGQALEAVSESRELYRLIAETSPDLIGQFDLTGTTTFVSPASEAILGLPPDEVVGTNFGRFFRPQEYPGVLAIFERVVAGERLGLIELEALRADGALVPVEVSATPILREGVIVGVLAIGRNISERRRAQEGLRRYQERLEQLLEERAVQLQKAYSVFDDTLAQCARVEQELRDTAERALAIARLAPVMLWTSDATGARTFCSDAWLSFRGRTPAEETGSGWTDGVHPDDVPELAATQAQAVHARSPYRSRFRLRRFDGEYRLVVADVVPRLDADGAFAGHIGCCVDVTEQG